MPDTSQARILLLGTDVAGTITGVTTGTSQPVNAAQQNQLAFFFSSQGVTSGGTIIIEEADWNGDIDTPYSGTWAQIASVSASAFSNTAQAVTRTAVPPSTYAFVRVRISADITGGGKITVALRMR